jgi:2-polyprenyl-3-methyl-5-hydroxy-6-metoxy-1,4-benzoquinol methylase
VVTRLWGAVKVETRVLGYGGGNDVFCTALRANGFPVAVTYDPMVPEYSRRPDGKFDLVTCFETLEHLPDPQAGITQIIECIAEPGLILFPTLLLPADFDTQRLNWWYIGPRNGHVSIFSKQALIAGIVQRQYPCRVSHLPPLLAHLQK